MSHFTVLVIGENPEEQLAPYHEFECTGEERCVQEIDVTEEIRNDYTKSTEKRVRMPDGSLVDPYDKEGNYKPEFLKEEGEGIFKHRMLSVPKDHELVMIPTSAVQSFRQFALRWSGYKTAKAHTININHSHKYGYILLADDSNEIVKIIKRTNPNKKWDWYSLGGRWRGFFKLKRGSQGEQGSPGVFDNAPEHDADSCLWGNVDVEGMRDAAGEKAGKRWDEIRAVIGPHIEGFLSWAKIREKHQDNIDAARTEYHAQQLMQALTKEKIFLWDGPEEFLVQREQYVEAARRAAISTFAVVKDGQWYERGSMGWWGVVSDEKDKDEWLKQFNTLLDSLSPETRVSVYDCHI